MEEKRGREKNKRRRQMLSFSMLYCLMKKQSMKVSGALKGAVTVNRELEIRGSGSIVG